MSIFKRIVGFVISVLIVIGVYYYVINKSAYTDLPLRLPKPVRLDKSVYLELIRNQERQREDEKDVPFRNSVLIIHDKRNDELTTFSARGRSTAKNRPAITDIGSYIKAPETSGTIRWGMTELPAGNYWVRWGTMSSGKPAFQISGVGWSGESIVTSESQTVRNTPVIETTSGTLAFDLSKEEQFPPTNIRTGCYIHGSITKVWSHRDSLGCVSLFDTTKRDRENGLVSEWERFLDSMQKLGLCVEDSPAILFIIREREDTKSEI